MTVEQLSAELANLRDENERLRNALKNLLRAAKVQNPLAGFPQAEEALKAGGNLKYI